MLDSLELMTANDGAQPTLVAALSSEAKNGQFWGPNGPGEQKGTPDIAKVDPAAQNSELNKKFYDWALETVGLNFP